jgi:hypothetical protein
MSQVSKCGEYLISSYSTFLYFSYEEIAKSTPDTNGKVDLDYYQVYQTVHHEYYHHLQIIGTSLGRKLTDLNATIGGQIAGILRDLFKNGIPSNFYRPFMINESFLKHKDQIILCLLDAKLKLLMGQYDKKNSGKLFQMIYNNSSLLTTFQPVPTISYEGVKYNIGAKQVLETFALTANIVEAVLINGIDTKWVNENIIEKHELDPYMILLNYVIAQLKEFENPYLLTMLLCDIALNGDPLDEDKSYIDFHPGYRFLKALEAIKNIREPLNFTIKIFQNDPDIINYYHTIYDKLQWKLPCDCLISEDKISDYFLKDVILVRKEHPLALIFPMIFFSYLQQYFKFSFDRHYPSNYSSQTMPEINGFNSDDKSKYEMYYIISTLMELTSRQLVFDNAVTCPWDKIDYPGSDICPDSCIFPKYFEDIYHISIGEYSKLPRFHP